MADVIDRSRRNLLTGRHAAAGPRPRPPWSSEGEVLDSCTRCGACAAACPEHIIRAGDGGFPEVDFTVGGCIFCSACAEACAEPVFAGMGSTPGFTHVVEIGQACLTRTGVVCQTCADVCPELAIRFHPRVGGPARPEVIAAQCSGCGACIAPCPVDAIRPVCRSQETADG